MNEELTNERKKSFVMSITIDDITDERLEQLAQYLSSNKSAVIRDSVREKYERYQANLPRYEKES